MIKTNLKSLSLSSEIQLQTIRICKHSKRTKVLKSIEIILDFSNESLDFLDSSLMIILLLIDCSLK